MRHLVIFLAAIAVAVAVPAAVPSTVSPLLGSVPVVGELAPADAAAYLHVADAQNTAVLHAWNTGYPNCNGWDRCYQFPQAVRYSRINDTAVNVLVRAYFRAAPNRECTRWFYVRGNDPGYIAGGDSSWWCV